MMHTTVFHGQNAEHTGIIRVLQNFALNIQDRSYWVSVPATVFLGLRFSQNFYA